MLVKELKELLNKCNDESNIFVGCEGYSNYMDSESDTNLLIDDLGNYILVDNCYYSFDNGYVNL